MTAASSALPAPSLMPLMRYRDLAEAMSWLERAFGFEKQIAVSDNDGEVIYGQMTYRGSLIMMGAVRDTDLDKLMRQPDEVGDVETQSCYVVVDDADAHYARAVEAGAEIVLEIKSDGLGRRGYSCRDPQGHIWSFGPYTPATGLAPVSVVAAETEAEEPVIEASAPRRSRAPMTVLAMLLLAVGASTWWFSDAIKADLAERLAHEQATKAEAAYAELAKVRAEKRSADARIAQLGQELETASAERQAETAQRQAEGAAAARARAEAERAQEELAETRDARLKAEAEAVTLRAELERQRRALDAASEAKRITEEKLAVKSAAEEARAKEMERQARQPDRPPVPLAGAKEHTPPAAKLAAEAAPPEILETSATGALPMPLAKPEPPKSAASDRDEEAETEQRARPAAKRSARRGNPKKNAAPAKKKQGDVPTYVINLSDVPWPYTTWYK